VASLLPGYNYDIFISYRQKDNKGDRWVSRFVEALKTELEATFKEDVSVYFDENPHDRLQETHNVNKSLEDKLKCLIFIPILSQTYCDPNSYAWQHELLAFLKMVKDDRLGKDVKLRSSNVASRILPIRIHELEPEDVKLFEKETGSVLRALDFVFRTATNVNRPLQPEDIKNDNLNRTLYRDQVNKVANALKEIILGMKAEPAIKIEEKSQIKEALKEVKVKEIKEVREKSSKANRFRFLIPTFIVALLIIAGVIAYPKIFNRDTLNSLRSSGERISVAVMPFQNMSGDTTWNYWQLAMQNIIVTSLSNSEVIRVQPTASINKILSSESQTNYFPITLSTASKISQKLHVSILIYGSIIKSGAIMLINAQLINPETEAVYQSFQTKGTLENIIQNMDTLSARIRDFLITSKMKSENLTLMDLAYTNYPKAYEYFKYGQSAFSRRDFPTAINNFKAALSIDSNYTYAACLISFAYGNQGLYDEAKKACLAVYKKRNTMSPQQRLFTEFTYAARFETPKERIKYLTQLLEINDQLQQEYYDLGWAYNALYQYDKAIPAFEKSLEMYKKLKLKPWWVLNYTNLGLAYHRTDQFRNEKKLYKKAEQDFPDELPLVYRQAILALCEKDTPAANEFIEKYKLISRESSVPEASILNDVAGIYSEAGILDKSEEYFRQALSLESWNPGRMNNLAYFLIDKDININEGILLASKALELSQDNPNILHTTGWGLYKQSKYEEAWKLLEKADSLRSVYNHELNLHLEAAKKAVAEQKGTER
jgi:tetratricopeptide (TPR) repeat protein